MCVWTSTDHPIALGPGPLLYIAHKDNPSLSFKEFASVRQSSMTAYITTLGVTRLKVMLTSKPLKTGIPWELWLNNSKNVTEAVPQGSVVEMPRDLVAFICLPEHTDTTQGSLE